MTAIPFLTVGLSISQNMTAIPFLTVGLSKKSKSIRPNRILLNSFIEPYRSLQCRQLELSRTCRNDVGISIFLFDHTMPNLTATTLRGAPVENIAITSAPWAHNEQCKKRSRKKENTEEALTCWNLERIIDAEQQGKDAPSELKMEDLLNEETGMEGDSEKDAGDVTFIN